MRVQYKILKVISYIYLYIYVLIFLFGWIRPEVAIVASTLIIWVFYRMYYKDSDVDKRVLFISKKVMGIILIAIIVWAVSSGLGGFCKQSTDWSKHNAILQDLITYKWPVYYEVDGSRILLSYYILFYLFPALIGKIGGSFFIAEIALLFQCIVGIFILYLHLCYFLRIEESHKQIIILILFASFGGTVLLGKLVYSVFHPLEIGSSYHWFSNNVRIQYSTNIVLLRWVFPQCIIPWITTILFMENPNRIEDYAWMGIPNFLYSSFAFAGLLPFYIGMAIFILIKDRNFKVWLKSIFSFQNITAFFVILPIFSIYIFGNVFQEKPDIVNFHIIDYMEKWSLYIMFCLSNFLIYSLLIWKSERKNIVYYIANSILLILPFFSYGNANDLCMRASIPSLFVISVLYFKLMMKIFARDRRVSIQFLLCMCLLVIAAIPSLKEISQNARYISLEGKYRNDEWGTLEGQLLRDGTKDSVAYNYVAYDCDDTFFVKYIARKNSQ